MAIPPFSQLTDQPMASGCEPEGGAQRLHRSAAGSAIAAERVCYSQASPDGQASLGPPAALQALHHEWDW